MGAVEAHLVSPAILALGDDGRLGVKTVEAENTVAFHPVEVVQAEAQGVWVRGLPDEARIVTLGQGFVRQGETVRVAEAEADALPEGPRDATAETPADAPAPSICDLDPQEDMALRSPEPEGGAAADEGAAVNPGAEGTDAPRTAPRPEPRP